MQKDNTVIFKGGKDGIVIVLDEEAGYEAIREALKLKIRDACKFFGSAKTTITFKGKEIEEKQMYELMEIITAETDLSISFVTDATGAVPMIMSQGLETEKFALPANQSAEISAADNMTHFRNGGLRSGQTIRYAGSVVLVGDVNAGAEIVAEGNIVVIGTVKGMVHAGCNGNMDCFVSALNMQPIQLRIADKITYIPTDMIKANKNKVNPVYAYIQDGQIYIAPVMD